jgi:hypothetical protein
MVITLLILCFGYSTISVNAVGCEWILFSQIAHVDCAALRKLGRHRSHRLSDAVDDVKTMQQLQIVFTDLTHSSVIASTVLLQYMWLRRRSRGCLYHMGLCLSKSLDSMDVVLLKEHCYDVAWPPGFDQYFGSTMIEVRLSTNQRRMLKAE